MGRIIAFDIGNKRIGVAISDPFNSMALPLETYWRKNFEKDLNYLANLAKEKGADTIVCGLPLNFDGSKSEQTALTESFVEELKKRTDIPIVFQDERFTTMEARRVLIEADMRREKRKDVIDKIAASYILEDYMRKINK
ncbi:MAG: Holliday junction resolvase RuvX [Clostridia bacterium]|nr:Holliday junction resolvase RuvX [Clostridia bacterium]